MKRVFIFTAIAFCISACTEVADEPVDFADEQIILTTDIMTDLSPTELKNITKLSESFVQSFDLESMTSKDNPVLQFQDYFDQSLDYMLPNICVPYFLEDDCIDVVALSQVESPWETIQPNCFAGNVVITATLEDESTPNVFDNFCCSEEASRRPFRYQTSFVLFDGDDDKSIKDALRLMVTQIGAVAMVEGNCDIRLNSVRVRGVPGTYRVKAYFQARIGSDFTPIRRALQE